MSAFCMECYNELKWVKREYSIPQVLNLSLSKYLSGNFVNRTWNLSKNLKPFRRLCFGRGSVVLLSSNGEGLRDIQHSKNMVLDTRFPIWFIVTFYYKIQQILLQIATAILLQNATDIYNKMRQVFYYKMRQLYYNMQQLLENAAILLQNTTVITTCDVY